MTSLSFLLCDDHALFRDSLAALLERQQEWQFVGLASRGEEAISLAAELQPDIAVIDVAMPGMTGIEVAEAIQQQAPQTRIMAVSMYGHPQYLQRMLAAGARAYILKNEAGSELVEAVKQVLQGQIYLSADLRELDIDAAQSMEAGTPDPQVLTKRERQVLRLLAEGQRTKDIAATLGISPKTVETYRSRMMLKLGIDNLAGLVKLAIRSGLISPE